MVKVKLFAGAAQVAGRREVEGPWEGLTPAELVARLLDIYPALKGISASLRVAINHEFAEPNQLINANDEVALLPPVSGGSQVERAPAGTDSGGEARLFHITDQPLSADAVAAKVTNPYSGAVVVFVGTVREFTRGRRTVHLEYEAYPDMAIRQMEQISAELTQRWPDTRTAITHRVGQLAIGEASVVIAVASPHRAEAFDACRHALERLKQIVPIWKKEVWEDGETWVGAQVSPH